MVSVADFQVLFVIIFLQQILEEMIQLKSYSVLSTSTF